MAAIESDFVSLEAVREAIEELIALRRGRCFTPSEQRMYVRLCREERQLLKGAS